MPREWSKITREHAIEAMHQYDRNPGLYTRAKHTFLVHDEKHYPAKAIRGIAYEVCFGEKISQEAFTGGKETKRFFERLGFEVLCNSDVSSAVLPRCNPHQSTKPKIGRYLDKVRQKNALQVLLQKRFGIVVSEKAFDWLRVPKELRKPYGHIYEALRTYRGNENFVQHGRRLPVDFYIESLNMVIEYDEDQHFSMARHIALKYYPSDLRVGFSIAEWMDICAEIKSADNNPVSRDETRAFYDAVRDIEILENGMHLLRIRHGSVDWEADDAETALIDLLKPYLQKPTPASQVVTTIADECDLADWRMLEIDVQRVRLNYLKWISHFTPQEFSTIQNCSADAYCLFESRNGNSFTAFPCGLGSVYIGGGKGQAKLPSTCFAPCSEMERETRYLKDSLTRRTQAVKQKILYALQNDDLHRVWRILLEYWWIKLGFHEYTHDVTYQVGCELDSIQSNGIRDYLIDAMTRGTIASDLDTLRFSKEEMLHFVRYRMRWDRYACCSFECGPIALGRSRYVPYEEIAAARHRFFSDRDIVDASDSDKRIMARDSLTELCDFLLLYYEEPLSLARHYRGFRECQSRFNTIISDTQRTLNSIIENECLDLPVFTYVPK